MSEIPKHKLSPLWEKALQNYREELSGDDDFRTIIETGSLDELLNDSKIKPPVGAQGRKALNSMNRMKPMVKLVNDFSAVLAVAFGADAILTTLIWGSIRMILTLASSAESTLQEVLNMLEELGLTLPRFRAYEQTIPMNEDLETSLLAVYTEVICFYARTIHFFRSRKNVLLLRNSWSEFRGDFNRTIQRIKRLSMAVEREVELTRMRLDTQKYQEVLDLMSSLNPHTINGEAKVRHYIPFTESSRFWGREDILIAIDGALRTNKSARTLRSYAIYGIGGVGKTQIALRYANQARGKFNGIFWISADNSRTIAQSLMEMLKTLNLIQLDMETDNNAVLLEVKKWLSTNENWLLIFDNADDLSILKPVWPGGATGSILLTSRDSNAAFSLASDGCQIKPFDMSTGSAALLNFIGLDQESQFNKDKANDITSVLGGLPLALSQIGGFIVQRKVPLQNFLALYERNSTSVDSRKTMSINYEHTLATVWEMSLSSLTGDSQTLHMILAFLDPDTIYESLLTEGLSHTEDPKLEFIKDEINLLDAEETLLQGALIDKSSENGIISMHRLIQTAIIRRMSFDEKQDYFSIAIDMLASSFPDTFTADVGHQVGAWARCERGLPHIENLIKQNKTHKIFTGSCQSFAELLLRCCWYLYEREDYSTARSYIEVALDKFSDHSSLAYASAIDLQGLIELDICRPDKALKPFEEAYDLRRTILAEDDPFLAANLVNIGLAYTELGEIDKAYDHLQKSIDMRLQSNSDRIGNSYSNMSSLLIRMGKADDAEEMLRRCPSLKDFTDETFLKTGNPRFSGDMVLMSRIRLMQGRYDEALSYASKALGFRRECLGERLKVCDSLYQVADILNIGGNTALAIQLLNECIKISEGLPDCEGQRHLARAYHKLGSISQNLEKEKEALGYMERARSLAREISKRDGCSVGEHTAPDFERLVPWMLW
ncbi:NB-ARC domain protein [Aspergillus sclerotialis]|uniref:NB-ARC domain protein n=1 Tax=Aspergillus sclerotialis TaxID=2070753 RepID=A0A3A2ZI16_9EURO|nr:NB-ARC domain protein [Aspergillus sclerotialis]